LFPSDSQLRQQLSILRAAAA